MAINPILFTNQVLEQFRRYQLTAFPLTDPRLASQVESMLEGDAAGQSPLVKGPYVSLSRSFQSGITVQALIDSGLAHPKLAAVAEFPTLFAHQEETYRAVKENRHVLISTGTGSGKTESFLYPIVDHCLRLPAGAPPGVVAILVYPMNALAQDQLGRLRRVLAGTGVTFGLYVGSTPDSGDCPPGYVRLAKGEGRSALEARQKAVPDLTVSPWEERITEESMAKEPPRILLTNAKQLELLLTRSKDLGMFDGAPLRFIVFDEVHTYAGVEGAEAALLVRRLRSFARKRADEVICIGTSATLTDPEQGTKAGEHFAHRFFGVDPKQVALVGERYEDEPWGESLATPPPPEADAQAVLDESLQALAGDGDLARLTAVVGRLTGRPLSIRTAWPAALYERLKANRYAKHLWEVLAEPHPIEAAIRAIHNELGWDPEPTEAAQAYLLTYLVLGAAAEQDGRPLLRPKVHYFIRGLEGAVASLEANGYPTLHFSGQEAELESPELKPGSIFPVYVCRTCGQHFLEAHLENFAVTGERKPVPSGGQMEGRTVIWRHIHDGAERSSRVLFTDKFLAEEQEDLTEEASRKVEKRLERKRFDLYVCRHCGCFHQNRVERCQNDLCGVDEPPVGIKVVGQVGQVLRCPACNQKGPVIAGKHREPIRPLRAIATADVHILAQDMLGAVDPDHRKLILFADNRQDAAFQAGWMRDHARRYRLRHLIWGELKANPAAYNFIDLAERLFDLLKNPVLGRALAPEVYRNEIGRPGTKRFEVFLRTFARVVLVRELTMSYMQRDGLEPWGLLQVNYPGLNPASGHVRHWASLLELSPQQVVDGIASLLDVWRRERILHEPYSNFLSRYWHEGDREVAMGIIPFLDLPPKGVDLDRDSNATPTFIKSVRSEKGLSHAQQFVKRWGVTTPKVIDQFLDELWTFLIEESEVLERVRLMSGGASPKELQKAIGAHQIRADQLSLVVSDGRYRCSVCQRLHARPTPNMVCTAHHCVGKLAAEPVPDQNYNVSLLRKDGDLALLRPEEHTAQVPAERRKEIEKKFKDPTGDVNCLVSSPTLEMGVDIGALDLVLLRNVPPTSSNYWQRAGRAGRRHRMAVVITYARRSQHDGYFFADPMRLLKGQILPPRFNLRNPVLIRKHVHAAVLSELRRMVNNPRLAGLDTASAQELADALNETLPNFVSAYLLEPLDRATGVAPYRNQSFRVDALGQAVKANQERVLPAVRALFAEGWPTDALAAVSDEVLVRILGQMVNHLQKVVDRLWTRMTAARNVLRSLGQKKVQHQLLNDEEQLSRRAETYLKFLTSRSQDNYTLSVLAIEGFLPGYGIQEGQTQAVFRREIGQPSDLPDFALGRPPLLAAREFVPGNLLYANGSRFKVVQYRFPVRDEGGIRPDSVQVDVKQRRLGGGGGGYDGEGHSLMKNLQVVEIADAVLDHVAHISDEEGNRFQLPVMVVGQLLPEHRGGAHWGMGGRQVMHLHGQKIRLVNAAPFERAVDPDAELGYPVCLGCGAVRSPYASQAELDLFRTRHTETCGRQPFRVGFSADAAVDGLWFPDLDSKGHAASLAEAIRLGAGQVLEMEQDDLLLLVLTNDNERTELFLYDPMPGGSGVLDQVLTRWEEILVAAKEILENCPSACEKACYDCLKEYQNLAFHSVLDRHLALKLLEAYDGKPEKVGQIPAQVLEPLEDPDATNTPEARLAKLIAYHHFPQPQGQVRVNLPPNWPIPYTVADYYYELPSGTRVAVYLDGLSKGIHGNAKAQQHDALIEEGLLDLGVAVVRISGQELSDQKARLRFMKRLAMALNKNEIIPQLADEEL